ncbi:MAG TPA: hypothetical protein VGK21_08635, partial [Candidatus Angelobacter sp.]
DIINRSRAQLPELRMRISGVIEWSQAVTNRHSVPLSAKPFYFQVDVSRKRIRILRVSRYLHSATLERAACFDHGEGDEPRFKEILDEASATVLYDRILMLLFAIGYGKRAERIQRTNFGYRG